MPDPTPVELLSFINEAFDWEELKTLCFRLNVTFDSLAGQTREAKARELIAYMQRVDRLLDLQAELSRYRPRKYHKTFGPVPTPLSPPRGTSTSGAAWSNTVTGRRVASLILIVGIVGVLALAVWAGVASSGRSKSGAKPEATMMVVVETETPRTAATLQPTQAVATATVSPSPTVIPSPTFTVTPTTTATATPQPQDGEIRVMSRGGLEIEQVYVPAGEFIMGSTNANDPSFSDEMPQRTVYLDAFWIDRIETTNRQYAACQSAGACPPPIQYSSASRPSYYYEVNLAFADYPVIYVDWNAANAFCKWAQARLPTEAEWEKAARGTDGRLFPWGNSPANCDLANFISCFGDTSPVGSYPEGASPYGVLDMAGNVWEWVEDGYQTNTYSVSPAINPHGPESSPSRVTRGGAWSHNPGYTRSAFRLPQNVEAAYYNTGLRCASD